MTAAEKKDIYNLLKSASSWTLGYEDSFFNGVNQDFEDDVVEELLAKENDEAAQPPLAEAQPKEKTPHGSTIETISHKIFECHNCTLSQTRKNVVPGEGVLNPYVLVVGEGPGEDEDLSGRPFVGKAGQLLDKMLQAISLDRNCNCYIANIVKCRPPHNRTPLPQEAAACKGFIQAQIHVLKPKMILAMGRTAVQNLMESTEGINALRGKLLDYHGIPLMATYHPSALLRDETLKRPAWNDLKAFRDKLLTIAPDYASSFNEKHPKA